jgi:hypothetical protein
VEDVDNDTADYKSEYERVERDLRTDAATKDS